MSNGAEGLAAFGVILALLGIFVAILWIILPFIVLRINKKMDTAIGEATKMNDNLLRFMRVMDKDNELGLKK